METVFQLAQDKGYRFQFEWDNPYKRKYKNLDDWKAIDADIIANNPALALSELTLIQKWLRDDHKNEVRVQSCGSVNNYLFKTYETGTNNCLKFCSNTHETYEEALVEGITEALKSLPNLLIVSAKNPLSTQLQKLTGDTWNAIDFEGECSKGSVITHKKTGLRFTVLNEDEYEAELNDWSRWNTELVKGKIVEVSKEIYEDMLECLPPRKWKGDYFEVGEPHHLDENNKPVHRAFWIEDGKYFTGYPRN